MSDRNSKDASDRRVSENVAVAPPIPADSFDAPPLNLFRSVKFKLRMHFSERYYGARAARIGPNAVVKLGARMCEIQAMDFIAKNTSIPVPRVLDVFTFKDKMHMVMEWIDGVTLHDLWRKLSEDKRQSIIDELGAIVREMRKLNPQYPGRIHGAGGQDAQMHDCRQMETPFGPFKNVDEYHDFIGLNYLRTSSSDQYAHLQPRLQKCVGRTYTTKFTHGDFAPYNIMIKDSKVAAVIDWETAGWYPEYWEYTSIYLSGSLSKGFWEMMREVLDPYPDELESDQCLSEVFTRN